MILTTSQKVKNTKEYKQIVEILERMERTSLIWIGRGQCISMSDVICTALFQKGIKAKMLECQAVITNNNVNPPESISIGFDNSTVNNQIDTHVICVTETEIPMFIDASISYLLPENKKIVVDEVLNLPNRVFSNITVDGFDLTYQQKTTNKVIFEHQKSILERIETDRKIFNNLNFLKIFVSLALLVGVVNSSRGFYDFYQKYYSSDNLIGVSATELILERLNSLENKIKNLK
jgi:hypothetical protein